MSALNRCRIVEQQFIMPPPNCTSKIRSRLGQNVLSQCLCECGLSRFVPVVAGDGILKSPEQTEIEVLSANLSAPGRSAA